MSRGGYVSSLRPDRSEPVLWHVTIERFDGYASISTTEADPDDALEELIRYAAVDWEADPDIVSDAAPCAGDS